jgi:hypothetical protein
VKSATREERGKEWRWKELALTQMTAARRAMCSGVKLASCWWRAATEAREMGSTTMMQRRAMAWAGRWEDDEVM